MIGAQLPLGQQNLRGIIEICQLISEKHHLFGTKALAPQLFRFSSSFHLLRHILSLRIRDKKLSQAGWTRLP